MSQSQQLPCTLPLEDNTFSQISSQDLKQADNAWAIINCFSDRFGKRIHSLTSSTFTCGRGTDCELRFTGQQSQLMISRNHFQIERKQVNDDVWVGMITDRSTNGTFVNDQRLEKNKGTILCHKDIISIGTPSNKICMYHDLVNDHFEKIPKEVKLNYNILSTLGQGGYGEVFLCIKKGTADQFAMKTIVVKQDAAKRVDELREANILRNVLHAHIVKFNEMIFVHQQLFLFMEFMPGGDLNALIKEKKKLSESVSKHIFYQVLSGVEYLHREKKIIHRDIKPANILLQNLDEYPFVKITDFGLSKQMKNEVTRVKTVCGTASFKPPELIQVDYKSTHDFRIDVWSLGILLYLCLTGEFPFSKIRCEIPLDKQIISLEVSYEPREIWEKFNCGAKKIIQSCLQKNFRLRKTSTELLHHHWFANDEEFMRRLGLSKENFKDPSRNFAGVFSRPTPAWHYSNLPANKRMRKD